MKRIETVVPLEPVAIARGEIRQLVLEYHHVHQLTVHVLGTSWLTSYDAKAVQGSVVPIAALDMVGSRGRGELLFDDRELLLPDAQAFRTRLPWNHEPGTTLRDVLDRSLGPTARIRRVVVGHGTHSQVSAAIVVEHERAWFLVLSVIEMLAQESIPSATEGFQVFALPARPSALDFVGERDLAIAYDDGAIIVHALTGPLFGPWRPVAPGLVPAAVEVAANRRLELGVAASRMRFHRDFVAISADRMIGKVLIASGKGWMVELDAEIRALELVPHPEYRWVVAATDAAITFFDERTGGRVARIAAPGIISMATSVNASGQFPNEWAPLMMLANRDGTISRLMFSKLGVTRPENRPAPRRIPAKRINPPTKLPAIGA